MPDIGWMELLVIGIVALIVVGPKDLPVMFRKLGQFTGRVRAMAKDFQRAMDDAADETGMTDLNRDLRKATQYAKYAKNPAKAGVDAIRDTLGEDFELDPTKYEEGSETRRIAEEKAASLQRAREEAEARRKARIDQTIADKQAAAAPTAAAGAVPTAPPAPAAAAEAPAAAATTRTEPSQP